MYQEYLVWLCTAIKPLTCLFSYQTTHIFLWLREHAYAYVATGHQVTFGHMLLWIPGYLYASVPTRSRISLCCHQTIHRFVQPTGYPYHMFVRLSGHPCSEFAYLYVLLLSIITNIILNLKSCTKKSFWTVLNKLSIFL